MYDGLIQCIAIVLLLYYFYFLQVPFHDQSKIFKGGAKGDMSLVLTN